MIRINYKPLSVNTAFKGRRIKTDSYKQYERDMLFLLPKLKVPEGGIKVCFVFGLSNSCNDIDNSVKQCLDIMQKKYGFNDKDVYRLEVDKIIVPKGKEFIEFSIEHYTQKIKW